MTCQKNTTPLDNETAELIRAAKDVQADDNGEGVEIDHKKAVYWYTKAAEQNHATAQFNLAMCYELGTGTEIDYVFETKKARKNQTMDFSVLVFY